MNAVAPQRSPVSQLPTTPANADLVSARDKALRDVEDFKRALGGKKLGSDKGPQPLRRDSPT